MNNYDDNNEVFQFDGSSDAEQKEFDYNNISGLGESNYENEDLFKIDESNGFDDTLEHNKDDGTNSDSNEGIDLSNVSAGDSVELENDSKETSEEHDIDEKDIGKEVSDSDMNEYMLNQETVGETHSEESNENLSQDNKIVMSNTPIEELNKLTEYKPEVIETTNINELFNKVSLNVKDASDIFKKNTEMKQKIDARFDELKQLQNEVENSKKNQIDEINNYKEEVLNKLNEKKTEIEKRLNTLKEVQANLEKEKKEFEDYKKSEQDKIDKIQKEVQSAYDDRREELGHIEDVLRRQKDALDEERNQLSLDKIQYESDKNDLANNLLKFNELVNSFTNGVSDIKED